MPRLAVALPAWLALLATAPAAVRLRPRPEGLDECPEGSACPEWHSETILARTLQAPSTGAMARHSSAADESQEPETGSANVSLPSHPWPAMFVAVFSAPGKEPRRHAARWAWHAARRATVRFVMCNTPPDAAAQQESEQYKDILFVDCEEGYTEGKLTKKLLATLKLFRQRYRKVPFFFKTDDDTFVQFSQLLQAVQGPSNPYVYAGVFYTHRCKPNRKNTSKWYEPYDVFPGEYYPANAAGGPGYALSQALLDVIFNHSIPEKWPLNNEDKAIGVWVKKAEEATGIWVAKVKTSGTDGYSVNKCETFRHKTWKEYDLVLQHKMQPQELACMGRQWKPDDGLAQCFCV